VGSRVGDFALACQGSHACLFAGTMACDVANPSVSAARHVHGGPMKSCVTFTCFLYSYTSPFVWTLGTQPAYALNTVPHLPAPALYRPAPYHYSASYSPCVVAWRTPLALSHLYLQYACASERSTIFDLPWLTHDTELLIPFRLERTFIDLPRI